MERRPKFLYQNRVEYSCQLYHNYKLYYYYKKSIIAEIQSADLNSAINILLWWKNVIIDQF